MTWKNLKKVRWKDLRRLDRAEVLDRLGLERKTPVGDFFSGLGLFALGMLVGAGLGMLFAPKPGAEMRSRMADTIKSRGQRMAEEYGPRLGMEPSSAGDRIS